MTVRKLSSTVDGDSTVDKNGMNTSRKLLLKSTNTAEKLKPDVSDVYSLEYIHHVLCSEPQHQLDDWPWSVLELLRWLETTKGALKDQEDDVAAVHDDSIMMMEDIVNRVRQQFCGFDGLLQAESEKPAIIDAQTNTQLSHNELSNFIQDFHLRLTHDLETKPIVAIALSNGPLLAVACLAVCTYYTAAPLSISGGEEQFKADVLLSCAKAILVTEQDSQRLRLSASWARETGVEVVIVRSHDNLTFTTSQVKPKSGVSQDNKTKKNSLKDTCLQLFTSGTSGKKKVVPISVYSMLCGVVAIAESYGLTSSDTCLTMMPLNHIAGIMRNLFTPVLSGGATICCPAFDVSMFWRLVNSGTPTWYNATPAIHAEIVRGAKRGLADPKGNHIRLVTNGASQLLPSLASQLQAVFNCPVMSSYGMTECIPIAATLLSESYSSGAMKVNEMIDVSIRDDDAKELAHGVVGNVCVRGGMVFSGYATAGGLDTSVFSPDGWFNTGDMGMLGQDGRLVLTGRNKEIINRGGETISPYEIEDAILRVTSTPGSSLYAKVTEIMAFPVPHTVLDEVVGVVVVANSSDNRPDLGLIRSALEASLHYSRWPAVVIYMEKLPLINRKLRRRNLAVLLGLGHISDDSRHESLHFQAHETDTGVFVVEKINMQPLSSHDGRAPSTDMEKKLQYIWARVLGVESAAIGADSSFLQLGGDSIRAIRLAEALQEEDLTLAVADVFASPKLSEMAPLVKLEPLVNEPVEPFSLMKTGLPEQELRIHAASQCGIEEQQIVDIFPCTSLQEGLFAMSVLQPGKYIRKMVFELDDEVDTTKFMETWGSIMATTPILRTRIVDSPGAAGLVQVIINEQIQWSRSAGLAEKELKSGNMGIGARLTQYDLVDDAISGRRFFVWTLHHAIYDAWSANLLLDQVRRAYRGYKPAELAPFQNFVQYVTSQGDEATQYWTSQLGDTGAVSFPKLPNPNQQPRADSIRRHRVENLTWRRGDITASTAIRTAWAVLMARYTGSPDVVFGSVVTGRQSPIKGVERTPGPTIATVPVRIAVQNEKNLYEMLQQVQRQAIEMSQFEQMGLQNIRRISSTVSQASQFQTLLVVHSRMNSTTQVQNDVLFPATVAGEQDASFLHSFNIYALMLECYLDDRGLQLDVSFDSAVIGGDEIDNMMRQFDHVLRQICAEDRDQLTVQHLHRPSEDDLQRIWAWNATVPQPVDGCVHHLITERANNQPDAPAVHAWDGDLTYRELDNLSTRLAHHLIRELGLQQNMLVPLCLEKSMWMPVAMLAVMKAGAASVSFDVSQPEKRLQSIAAQIMATCVVSSTACRDLATRLDVGPVVAIDRAMLDGLHALPGSQLPLVSPSSTLFVVFTSGSTGAPKGTVISHANFSSAIKYQQSALGFDQDTRVYDFVSYAFDIAWANFLHAMTAGACLCVPSETKRKNDLAGSMNRLRANFAFVTPSVARLISPAAVPGLKTLVLGGEPITGQDTALWSSLRHFKIVYGPAECSVVATCKDYDSRTHTIGNLGQGIGLKTWVAAPTDDMALVPLGGVGELVLEGPLVGQGYFADSEKTTKSFISDPNWLTRGCGSISGRRGRVYRTGDMVKYNMDGTLSFVMRKDSQVKIRGQRVELGEVEHAIRRSIVGDRSTMTVVAEVISPKGSSTATLVAFLAISIKRCDELGGKDEAIQYHTKDLESRLAEQLPIYMVPSAYVVLDEMPMTSNGKADRRRLRDIGTAMTAKELAKMQLSKEEWRAPETEVELRLQKLWASVIGIDPVSIGADDSFLRIGGDSIAAIRLVAAARAMGLSFTVADILSNPKLWQLAKVATIEAAAAAVVDGVIPPFSLLSSPIQSDIVQVKETVAMQCGVSTSMIEDMYPCTPLQEGLLALTAKSPGAYISKRIWVLSQDVDMKRFQEAWTTVYKTTSILRTRIVDLPGQGLVQAVINDDIPWNESIGMETYTQRSKQETTGLAAPLVRFGFIVDPDDGKKLFSITLHHVVYDGWSKSLIFKQVEDVYRGKQVPQLAPYVGFVRHIHEIDANSTKYWEKQLTQPGATIYPQLPSPRYQPHANELLQHSISQLLWPSNGITPSTAIRAAWAILMMSYTGSADTVFGVVVSGRHASVPGIERMAGPTIATVPLRVALNEKLGVVAFLDQVQSQAIDMTSHEQMGLSKIRSISSATDLGSQFQTLLVVQPRNEEGEAAAIKAADALFVKERDDSQDETATNLNAFNTYAIMVECRLAPTGLRVNVSFDSAVITRPQINRLVLSFEHILRQLGAATEACLVQDLHTVSKQDLADIWSWNKILPPMKSVCVHESIAKNARLYPDRPAVCAWDGKLTYCELDNLSTKLAWRMVDLDAVTPGTTVCVCMEKSIWMPVALLAIWKCGAVAVSVSSSAPKTRLRSMLSTQKCTLLLTGGSKPAIRQDGIAVHSVGQLINTGSTELDTDKVSSNWPGAASEAVILYTSGSSGTPKGVVWGHDTLATNCEALTCAFSISPSSRVLQFASYDFDVSLLESCAVLLAGGCLCIPSESERSNGLQDAMHRLQVNWACLTPSASTVISPAAVPLLQTVVFTGEKLEVGVVSRWKDTVSLYNWYGPAEAAAAASCRINDNTTWTSGSIGSSLAAVCWITDPENPERLLPVGAVGEALLEGPVLAHRYVGSGDANANSNANTAFVSPAWLLRGGPDGPGRHGRLYRSGDFVRYNTDGTLIYIGRKDSQVKIRGQRVELAEVECTIKRCLEDTKIAQVPVVAEIITPRESSRPVLVAFLALGDESAAGRVSLEKVTQGLQERLMDLLPRYMVPRTLIPVDEIPLTTTGKTNRRQLREMGAAMTLKQLIKLQPSNTQPETPTTETERQLQSLWSQVLGVEAASISRHDSFLHMGDSIAAMRLVAAALTHGLAFTVADIFNTPRLCELAKVAQVTKNEKDVVIEPFSLLSPNINVEEATEMVAAKLDTVPSQIEDIYPCTPLQEGLLALTTKNSGAYVSRKTWKLPRDTDISRFKRAWNDIYQATPILRTRIVDVPGQGLVQVVLTHDMPWSTYKTLHEFNKADSQNRLKLGRPLSYFALITEPNCTESSFVWVLHHALYDGHSLPLILDAVQNVYDGLPMLELESFRRFIQYLVVENEANSQQYWRDQLENSESVLFPALPSPQYEPVVDTTIHHQIRGIKWPENDITASTALRASWAILVARYTNSSDVVFGATVNGRQAAVHGISRMAGPTFATVPVRARIDWDATVDSCLLNLQKTAIDMIPFEQTGLPRIRQICGYGIWSHLFQSLLVIEHQQATKETTGRPGLFQTDRAAADDNTAARVLRTFNTYSLSLIFQIRDDGADMQLNFDSNVVPYADVARIGHQFQFVLQQICATGTSTIKLQDVKAASPIDLEQIWRFNATVLPPVERCMHDIISERARNQPKSLAIHSWDGDLSYEELDNLSSVLARHLVRLGLQPNTIVPLYFAKCKWTPVAMLGVMKAGGACLVVDISQPEDRLVSIFNQVQPAIALGQTRSHLFKDATFVSVNDKTLQLYASKPSQDKTQLPTIDSSNLLYVVFTSGTTGTPKGVMISHANYSSAIHYQVPTVELTSADRVLDFASYAFDVAWANVLNTLSVGACLCIPSETERNDPSRCINQMGITWADMTSSVADLISPESVPSLRVLALGGEPVTQRNIETWHGKVPYLYNVYGPAECTPTSITALIVSKVSQPANIGRGAGVNTWLTVPSNPHALAPVGAVGELWLEGPLVGQGYLHAAAGQTKSPGDRNNGYVEDPVWLVDGRGPGSQQPGRRGHVYRTGDLVKYNNDGTLLYIGRKDGQVKIRGQRVELSDIEHHVGQNIPSGFCQSVVVDNITPENSQSAILVAFFVIEEYKGQEAQQQAFAHVVDDLNNALAEQLPAFMIPTAYIPIRHLPTTISGKVNKQTLRSIYSQKQLGEIIALQPSLGSRRQAVGVLELSLQRLYASTLGLTATDISADDSFLRIGGDSIGAMRLVEAASREQLSFSVADVFRNPRLCDLAKVVNTIGRDSELMVEPFSLLSADTEEREAISFAATECGVRADQIQDIFPCAPLQEGLLSLTTRRSTDYIMNQVLEVGHTVDLVQFRDAWQTVVATVSILRTRIIDLPGQGLMQTIIDEPVTPSVHDISLSAYLDSNKQQPMGLGTRLCRLAVVNDGLAGKRFLVMTIHHAAYDGVLMNLILKQFARAYRSTRLLSFVPFQNYAKHIIDARAGASEFWQAQFANCEAIAFPALPAPDYQPTADDEVRCQISSLAWGQNQNDITPSATLRTALAILIARHTYSSDIVFGAVVSGRQASVRNVTHVMGPTIATVPVRVYINWDATIHELLSQVQTTGLEMTQFEQTGLQHISRVSGDAKRGCAFQTLLVIQPPKEGENSHDELLDGILRPSGENGHITDSVQINSSFSSHALVLICQLHPAGVAITASFDSHLISRHTVKSMTLQLEKILQQLVDDGPVAQQLKVKDVETASAQDLSKIWTWNANVPEPVEACLHEMIAKKAASQPNAAAVHAWDGDLTYRELDDLSTALACHLVQRHHVQQNMLVPLYFEKSMWVPVSMLAVMKSGAACVALDAEQPQERLRSILHQIAPALVLCASEDTLTDSLQTTAAILSVNKETLSNLINQQLSPTLLPAVNPSSILYVVFTSGSTGAPKGAIITHSNFSSAIHYQRSILKFDQSNQRVLDFASYAFDVAWINVLHTLTSGNCLCVPSAEQRRTDLVSCINRMKITYADITSSVLNLIPRPEDVPTFRNVFLGGEPMTRQNVRTWHGKAFLTNAYGPAECTPTATAASVTSKSCDPANIGRGFGLNTWVITESDTIAPLGAVGELWLEGPLVGQGYLSDPEKTAKSFPMNPKWLATGASSSCSGRQGRLYRTGDLVRYDADGSLLFVGRVDGQVKIHGQRIELGEVEYHVRHTLCTDEPHQTDVAAEIITPAGSQNHMLVAFVVVPGTDQTRASVDKHKFATLVSGVSKKLRDVLPSFMVPAAFLPAHQIPTTASGKRDRKSLQRLGASFTMEQLLDLQLSEERLDKTQTPKTEAETQLQQLVAQVLKVDASRIGIHDSFFSLGGDSISAMLLSAKCRTSGYSLSVAQIFKNRSVANMAACAIPQQQEQNLLSQGRNVEHDVVFGLSPIQSMFFEVEYDGNNQFNQSFLLRLKQSVEPHRMLHALDTLVAHHAMLRCRFQQAVDGTWLQSLKQTTSNERLYGYHEYKVECIQEAAQNMVRTQQSLDIGKGPLFALDFITTNDGEQFIFMVAHHLIIDVVSWGIILQDMEELLRTASLSAPPAMSFQSWCLLQAKYAKAHLSSESVLPFTINTPADYWGLSSHLNTHGNTIDASFCLDELTTTALLGPANDAFQTKPAEILHAALLLSFAKTFPDRAVPTIFAEGHGREPWTADIDLSRTVGWFTTVWPANVAVTSETDLIDAVRFTKDVRRQIPMNGWAYFCARYLTEDGVRRYQSHGQPEILFNYLGFHGRAADKNSIFSFSTKPKGVSDFAQSGRRLAMIDVSAFVLGGKLQFEFTFSRDMKFQNAIQSWINGCSCILSDAAHTLVDRQQEFTLSDFPLAGLTYNSLDCLTTQSLNALQVSHGPIEDVYPCSPVQAGILLSQARDANHYQNRIRWCVRPSSSSSSSSAVDLAKLQQAWKRVVQRHPILRTVFVNSVSSDSNKDQVVLKEMAPEATIVDCVLEDVDKTLSTHWQNRDASQRPLHSLALCRVSTGEIICELSMSHAIMDAVSVQLIKNDFWSAYDQRLLSPTGPPYSSYIQYLQQQNKGGKATEYWHNYLEGAQSCLFPKLVDGHPSNEQADTAATTMDRSLFAKLRQFCQKYDLTLPNIFHVAWGLVLLRYTGLDTVCFGYLTSGRDVPVPDVDHIVGPFINMLVTRMDFHKQDSIMDIIQKHQTGYSKHLDNQHLPLLDILTSVGTSAEPLFNTVVAFQKVISPISETARPSQILLQDVKTEDPTEYDMILNIGQYDEKLNVSITYREALVCETVASRISNAFLRAVEEIIDNSDSQPRQLDILSLQDQSDIWHWNANVPAPVETCVHDMIAHRVSQQPDAPAVHAWDGDLTYQELHDLSTSLAHHLIRLGVKRNTIVPLHFTKSMWMPVAMLAVIKAGGASVALDVEQPTDRLVSILQQVQPRVILTSADKAVDKAAIPENVDVISVAQNSQFFQDQQHLEHNHASLPAISPSSMLYVVFTSGSTGTPKGVIITHTNFSSAIRYQGAHLGYDGETIKHRVFDFASYAFDIAWSNVLHTLTSGGCLCIPSDVDRKDNISACMASMGVTYVDMTPSTARLLDPSVIPSLQVIVLGGELVRTEDIQYWQDEGVVVKVMYGPSECTPNSTGLSHALTAHQTGNIGRGLGVNTWIVLPSTSDHGDDDYTLAPVGVTGELWLEGPLVGQGYLCDSKKTAASFVQDPAWLVRGSGTDHPGRRGRLYKTGDLVRYSSDGTLAFIGRKDNQVKIRGQRVELAEVEYSIKACLSSNISSEIHIVAEIITPADGKSPLLVAFLAITQATHDSSESRDYLKQASAGLYERLTKVLPVYMVPSAFIPVAFIPMTISGKTDRRKLAELGASMTLQRLAELQFSRDQQARAPSTQMEQHLQRLWANTLGVAAHTIRADDSFLRIGGDSIAAMRLVTAARNEGLSLTVADILRVPQLAELALVMGKENSKYQEAVPFSLISPSDLPSLRGYLASHNLHATDAYPVTDFQSACIASSLRKPIGSCYHIYLDLPQGVDTARVADACVRLWNHLDILRTVFIEINGHHLQAVCEDIAPGIDICKAAGTLSQVSEIEYEKDAQQWVKLGSSSVRFLITQTTDKHVRVTIRLSHAQYDGLCLSTLFSCFAACMQDTELPIVPKFSSYILQAMRPTATSLDYWRNLLEGSQASILPRLQDTVANIEHATSGFPAERLVVSRTFAAPLTSNHLTPASSFIALCACSIANITQRQDVVLGLLVSGRATLDAELQQVIGPCINITPLRVNVHLQDTKMTMMERAVAQVHQQRSEALRFETTQLTTTVEDCTDWPREKNSLRVVVYFQNIEEEPEIGIADSASRVRIHERYEVPDTDVVRIIATPVGTSWDLQIIASTEFYATQTIENLMHEFASLLNDMQQARAEVTDSPLEVSGRQ